VVNFLEDLDLFLATPDLPFDVANRYLELRYDTLLSAGIGYRIFPARKTEKAGEEAGTYRDDESLLTDIRAALADPKFAKVADFLAFLELAVTANQWASITMATGKEARDKDGEEPTYWGRDYVKLEKMCRAWLEKYPKSTKREAALLLHCRALRHAMSPFLYYRQVAWPVAPRWEGGSVSEPIERMKFDAKRWKAALDRYDKEFPKGRYAADMLSNRADLAVRLKDWKRALQISLAQRESNPHLQPDAANRLEYIFAQLAKDEDRAELLAAIRVVGGARGALQATLKRLDEGPENPLDRLRSWLEEQATQ
jgi:hypothetical protein